MELTILHKDGKKAVLLVKDASNSLLNALRRSILARLPAFAIDEVDFYENTSPMFNEYLANRLALVPLSFDESTSEDAKISLSLDAEAVEDTRTVYSHEITSSDPAIKVFAEKIPLIKLGKGQKLRFEATAVLGTPVMHSKFQSAFANYAELEDFKLSKKCKKCATAMVPRESALDEKILPAAKIPEACLLCFDCEDLLKSKIPSGMYVLTIESFNNLPPLQHLKRAVELIDSSLEKLSKELKE